MSYAIHLSLTDEEKYKLQKVKSKFPYGTKFSYLIESNGHMYRSNSMHNLYLLILKEDGSVDQKETIKENFELY